MKIDWENLEWSRMGWFLLGLVVLSLFLQDGVWQVVALVALWLAPWLAIGVFVYCVMSWFEKVMYRRDR